MDIIEEIVLTKQEGFDLMLQAHIDHDTVIDEDFLDKSLLKETLENLNSGNWILFTACVTASKEGVELGRSHYLGGCIHESLDEFKESGYLPQMVEEAISQAKELIIKLTQTW